MTLQRKTLIIIGVTLVCLLAGLYLVSRYVLLRGFDDYEMTRARRETEMIRRAYLSRLQQLDVHLQQLSAWDAMAAYVQHPDTDFEESNFVDSAFESLGLNVILVLDPEGNVVFARGYDMLERRAQPVSLAFLRAVESTPELRGHTSPESAHSGLVDLPEDPMLVVSRPIVSSDFEGPVRGTLILGRYADGSLAAQSGEFLERKVTALDWEATPPPLRAQLEEPGGICAQALDDLVMAAYARIEDMKGAPVLTLYAELPRDIHVAKVITGQTLLLSLLITSIVFGTVVIVLLRYSVLSRVASLENEVRGIAGSGDARRRVVLRGNDELARLAESVNSMLEALEASREALRYSEETSRALMNATLDSAFLVKRDGRIVDVNDAGARRLGMNREEITGANFQDLFQPALADSRMARIQEAFESRHPVRFEDRRGDVFFDVTLYPVESGDGQTEQLALFAHDISEIRQAEQALRESRARYKQLVQGVNSVVLRWDPQGRITFMNEYGQGFFGWPWEELVGHSVVGTIVPETDAAGKDLRSMVADVLRNPEKYVTQENENIKKNGERVWMSWSNRPIFDDDGNLVEILSIGNDISRRRRAEQSLLRRVQMEELVAAASSRFLRVTSTGLRDTVDEVLGSMAQFVGADRAYIYVMTEGKTRLDMIHEWCAPGIASFEMENTALDPGVFPWFAHTIVSEGAVNVQEVGALPEAAAREKEALLSHGVQSLLDVPMLWHGEIFGLLGFSSISRKVAWAQDDIRLLKVVGGILVAAFRRARAEDAVLLQNRRLETLLQLQEMTDPSPRVMSSVVLRSAVEVTRSAFGVMGRFEPATGAFVLEQSASQEKLENEMPWARIEPALADEGLWETLQRTRKPVTLQGETLPAACRDVFVRFLAVPIIEGDLVVSVAAVANKAFDYEDTDVSQFQLLMTSAWNQIKRNEDSAWIQREVDEIANIQRALLPHSMPTVRGMRVRAFSSTFDRAGGDYYDVLPVGAAPGADLKKHSRWLVLIADVSGHGPSSAVIVTMLSTLLRVRCGEDSKPARIFNYLNEYLMAHTVRQTFVTGFLAMIDLDARTVVYCNAGHNPPLIRTPDGTVAELEHTGDIPLSVLGDWTYSERTLTIETGSTLWLYTDGVVETLSPSGEAFGEKRLRDAIGHLEGESSRAVAELVGMLRAHEAGRRPNDDQVIMLVEFT
ncbi:MAG TPA: SpoIIE family protein phosphatase [Candidatus Hydrogenedentes bacterium]|nr:SpoIIE family protein phosphatase [Candidatus Hydrogenedentota bacterium]